MTAHDRCRLIYAPQTRAITRPSTTFSGATENTGVENAELKNTINTSKIHVK